MNALAWTTLVVVCGVVWGGFLSLLVRAMRSEARKAKAPETDAN